MTPYELLRRTTPVQDATKAELLRHDPPPRARRAAHAAAGGGRDAAGRALLHRPHPRGLHRARGRRRTGTPARARPAGLAGTGVVGVALDEDDPLVDEWAVVLPGADPVVFAATDLRVPGCEDDDRCFSYGVSRDRSSSTPAAACSGSERRVRRAGCACTSRVIRRSTTNDRNGTVPASATSSVRTTDQPARRARSTVTPEVDDVQEAVDRADRLAHAAARRRGSAAARRRAGRRRARHRRRWRGCGSAAARRSPLPGPRLALLGQPGEVAVVGGELVVVVLRRAAAPAAARRRGSVGSAAARSSSRLGSRSSSTSLTHRKTAKPANSHHWTA